MAQVVFLAQAVSPHKSHNYDWCANNEKHQCQRFQDGDSNLEAMWTPQNIHRSLSRFRHHKTKILGSMTTALTGFLSEICFGNPK
jgi:hypothetical protein